MANGETTSGLTRLFEAAAAVEAAGRGLPPVARWNPERCGEIDILIRADGAWIHEGAPITRPALVRLFSTVLRREPDGYYLVTPAEKLRIRVEDAPFVAVGLEAGEGVLRFATNVGDIVEAGPHNQIRVESRAGGEPRPYLHVRDGLEALIARPVFYELAQLAQGEGAPGRKTRFGVWSKGAWFELGVVEGAGES